MKPILVPTDFSKPAGNAAKYAINLCGILKTNIYLCHAFLVPADAMGSAQTAWPLIDYSSLDKYYEKALNKLAGKLEDYGQEIPDGKNFQPVISCAAESGEAIEVIEQQAAKNKPGMIVMGMSGAGAISRFLIGSVSRRLLQKSSYPVLLIPQKVRFKMLKKIAFATNLNDNDIDVINSFVTWIAFFNAELVIAHIVDDKDDPVLHQKEVDEFMKNVGNKINYDRIYFRQVASHTIDEGLDWLAGHGQIDMLAIVHHQHGALSRIFLHSHTLKLAGHTHLPLLVFPSGRHFTF